MINQLEFFLADRGIYMLALMLMAVGVYGMISCGNYMKKLICMNIMQVAIIFFFLTFGQKDQATLPVILEEVFGSDAYINPLPHAKKRRLPESEDANETSTASCDFDSPMRCAALPAAGEAVTQCR